MLSSPAALAETIRERLRRLGAPADQGAEENAERQALEQLDELTARARRDPSAKYRRLSSSI